MSLSSLVFQFCAVLGLLCAYDVNMYFHVHTGKTITWFVLQFPSDPVHIPSPDTFIPGRFGMAVAVIGDSDGDGISDVAISAPYLGSGGVVYICRGFRGGILTPEQASTLNLTLPQYTVV